MNKVSPISQYNVKNSSNLRKETFFYFFHLDEHNLSDFSENWERFKNINFNSKGLVNILHQIAEHLTNNEFPADDVEHAYRILSQKIDIWCNKAVNHIEQFNPQGLSNSLWALAALGISPPNWFIKEWMGRTSEILDGFNTQDLCNSYWALAVLDSIKPNEEYRKTAELIRTKIKDCKLSHKGHIKQTYDADLWFKGETNLENIAQKETKSSKEKQLCEIFNIAGFTALPSEHNTVPGLPKAIDFAVIDISKKQFVLMESDGKYHFLGYTSAILDGPTLFRGALIHKLRPDAHILRMGMHTGNYILNSNPLARDQICRTIFNETVKKPPGIYRTAQRRNHRIVPLIPMPMTDDENSPAQKFG